MTDKINEAVGILKNKSNASSVFAGNDEGIALHKTASEKFFKDIPAAEREAAKRNILIPHGNEAVIINSDVNYNLIAAPLDEIGADRDGELYVTESIVNDKLLMPQLRYTKGAYGVNYDVNEYGMYIASYRDPQLADTLLIPFGGDEIRIYVDGSAVESDTAPVIKNDRTLVPIRAVAEALGADVKWYDADKRAEITLDGETLVLSIGSYEMKAGDRTVAIDAAPEIINERTMVPLRAVSEVFDKSVSWKKGCVVIK